MIALIPAVPALTLALVLAVRLRNARAEAEYAREQWDEWVEKCDELRGALRAARTDQERLEQALRHARSLYHHAVDYSLDLRKDPPPVAGELRRIAERTHEESA